MAEFEYAEIEVDGKKLKDWLKSDEGLVDYEKCRFGVNVSNTKGIIIYDLGEFEHDPEVGETRYHNGVDLARVIGAVEYKKAYKGMPLYTALNGDDFVRIFFNGFEDATTKDLIMYHFHLLDGDVYISETNYHVFVRGRNWEEEEWKAAVKELYSRARRKD